MSEHLWWHCYGGVTDNGICTIIYGEATTTPTEAFQKMPTAETSFGDVVPYLRSYSHELGDEDRAELDEFVTGTR